MKPTLKKYVDVWMIVAKNALQEAFINRATNSLFIFGKFIRLGISLLFLFIIRQQITTFAGYSKDEIVLVFLIYLFIDTVAQAFFRGVYTFTPLVRNGEFDFYLGKPISPLFRALMGRPDINDVVFLLPTTVISLYLISSLQLSFSLFNFGLFLFLFVNSMILATALHIWVLIFGILTTEVQGFISLYRDLTRLSMVPVHIYASPMRILLFTLIPIGVMNTIPSDVLLGKSGWQTAIAATIFGSCFLGGTLFCWRWALKQYSSASS